MGKGGVILGLIGILIGAGGLVFGFIAWNTANTIQTTQMASEIWYVENDGPFNVTPAVTVLEVTNLSITFALDTVANIYLSFTCHAAITASGTYSSVFFFFRIDGVNFDDISNRVGNNVGGSTNDYYSVNLQLFIENMAAGSHNVTMGVSTENIAGDKFLTDMTLFVQSFSS